jgi:hypothetical protein
MSASASWSVKSSVQSACVAIPELAYFARNLLRVASNPKINASKLVEAARFFKGRQPETVPQRDQTLDVLP